MALSFLDSDTDIFSVGTSTADGVPLFSLKKQIPDDEEGSGVSVPATTVGAITNQPATAVNIFNVSSGDDVAAATQAAATQAAATQAAATQAAATQAAGDQGGIVSNQTAATTSVTSDQATEAAAAQAAAAPATTVVKTIYDAATLAKWDWNKNGTLDPNELAAKNAEDARLAAAATSSQNIFTGIPANQTSDAAAAQAKIDAEKIENIFGGAKEVLTPTVSKGIQETGGTSTTTTTGTTADGNQLVEFKPPDSKTIGADGTDWRSVLNEPITTVSQQQPTITLKGGNILESGPASGLGGLTSNLPIYTLGGTTGTGVSSVTPINKISPPAQTAPKTIDDFLTSGTKPTAEEMQGLIDQRIKSAQNVNKQMGGTGQLSNEEINDLVTEVYDQVYTKEGGLKSLSTQREAGPFKIGIPAIIPIPGLDPTTAAIISAIGLIRSGGQISTIDPTDPLGSLINIGKGIFNPSAAAGGGGAGGGTGGGAGAGGATGASSGPQITIKGATPEELAAAKAQAEARQNQPEAERKIAEDQAQRAAAEEEARRKAQEEQDARIRATIMGVMGQSAQNRAAINAEEVERQRKIDEDKAITTVIGECQPNEERINGRCVPKCGEGMVRDSNGNCVPATVLNPECQPNEERINGRCVPKCKEGMVRDANGNCVPATVLNPECGADEERINGRCVPKCKEGMVRDANGNCVPATVLPPPTECKADEERVNGQCVPKCKEGMVRNAEGVCVSTVLPPPPPPPTECKADEERVNGQCVPKCKEGMTRNAEGVCVSTVLPPPPPPTECKADEERVNGQCVPKCKEGMTRNAAGVCVAAPIVIPPPVPTPTTTPGGTFNVTVTGDTTPITYTAPKTGDPFMRNIWQEASTNLGALNAPIGRQFLGYEMGPNNQPVAVYSEPSKETVGEGITRTYGEMAGGMTKQDIARLRGTFGDLLGDLKEGQSPQRAMTDAAIEQTRAANRALREGNLADAAEFGMKAQQLRDAANAGLFGATGALPQYTQAAQTQLTRDIEALRAAERGELSRESIRAAQQAAREAAGARGQVMSRGAAAQEVLNREAAIQQRQQQARQNLAQSMGQLGQGIGYQTANVFDPMAAALGQQYGMQTTNVGLNQALYNQAMGLASGQGGYGFAQQMVNPFSQYSGDVYGTNVNARNAFMIQEANRAAALEAARMGEAAARNAANTKLALGGVDFLYKYGMGQGWWG